MSPQIDPAKLREGIRREKIRSGRGLRQIARDAQLSDNTVYQYSCGSRRFPRPGPFARLARQLHCLTTDLLTEDDVRGSYPEEQGPSEEVEAAMIPVPAEQRRQVAQIAPRDPADSREGDVIRVDSCIPSDSPFYLSDREYPRYAGEV